MNNEDIEDGVFEEIIDRPVPDREVILTKDLSEEDLKKIEESEMAPLSPEDAAAFAKELEEAQKDVKTVQTPDRPLTQQEMLAAVNGAVKEGMLSKYKKQRLMRDMGIFKSTFTKKTTSKPSAAKKRKAAKNARKKNRK